LDGPKPHYCIIQVSDEIILKGEVVMMALVESLGAEEISRWAGSCDRAFAIPVEADNIIGAGFDGALVNIVTVFFFFKSKNC
jgi:hypothetical protein